MRSARALLLLLAWGCSPQAETVGEGRAGPSQTERGAGQLTVLVDVPGGGGLPELAFLRWIPVEPGGTREVDPLTGHLVSAPSAEGVFELEVPTDQAVEVVVCAGDLRVRGRSPAPINGPRVALRLELPLPKRLVVGRLVRPDGTAIGGVRVDIGLHSTLARPDGSFEVSLPGGQDSLLFEAEGFPSVRLPWSGGTEPLEVVLEPGGALRLQVGQGEQSSGRVVCQLSDEGGANTWHSSGSEGGTVDFEGLPTGQPLYLRVYRAVPSPAPSLPVRERDLLLACLEVFQLASGERIERSIGMPPAGPIGGRLLDQEGRGLAGVELCLAVPRAGQAPGATYLDHAHLVLDRTITDSEGLFLFEDAPGGTWLVGVARGAWNTQSPVGRRASPAALLMRAGESDGELTIAVGLNLTGRVVVGEGLPPRTRVEARPRAFSGARETFTTREGTFLLEGLMPGPHDLYLDGELAQSGVDPAVPSVGLTLELAQ